MSLMDDFKAPCARLVPKEVPDGEGGNKTAWLDGDAFEAVITFNNSLTAKRAEKEGVTSLYTVTVDKALRFNYHDVFRRETDGKVFRVTSDGDDKHTPSRATFQVAQFTAEEWRLPT